MHSKAEANSAGDSVPRRDGLGQQAPMRVSELPILTPALASAVVGSANWHAGSDDAGSSAALPESAPIKLEVSLPRVADGGSSTAGRAGSASFAGDHFVRFNDQLADRVMQLRAHGLERASIALDPADLGRIEIRLRMDADTTHVSFVAHNAGVREAIEAQLPRLRNLLEASGLALGDVDVNQSGGAG
ncbi:MAG: flagellar hook-length control protein FliK [Gammaproteobacteria bacterium]|nr:flagellar hook-length control protein FliK [Gammaproteobacteria bacterium]